MSGCYSLFVVRTNLAGDYISTSYIGKFTDKELAISQATELAIKEVRPGDVIEKKYHRAISTNNQMDISHYKDNVEYFEKKVGDVQKALKNGGITNDIDSQRIWDDKTIFVAAPVLYAERIYFVKQDDC